MNDLLIDALCKHYLSGKEYPIVRLVNKKFSDVAKQSMFWHAKIYYSFPKGKLKDYILADSDQFTTKNPTDYIVFLRYDTNIIYAPSFQAKFALLEKLHNYETNLMFTPQEIVQYYFISKELTDDFWGKLAPMAHKSSFASVIKDWEIVRSQTQGDRLMCLKALVEAEGDLVNAILTVRYPKPVARKL
eukprot:Phypoly_transcript_19570.p1 GENE.Phypoly_transcript_19570~~Phypoly_transcript_19570.p1  ORF type:complete len:188 (+),score=24.84 Phypoly_transcript_19570:78-641(+)